MRILFIRHGDPDYINDTLTKKGHREAKLLAERAADLNLGSCYVSPLGRAKDTAQYCLDKVGKTAQTVEWLREFPARIDLNQAVHLQKAYPTAEKENGRMCRESCGISFRRIGWNMENVWTGMRGENPIYAKIQMRWKYMTG